jgi:O-methyltransferase
MKKEHREFDIFELHHQPAGKFYFNGVRVVSDQIDLNGLELIWETLLSVVRNNTTGDVVEFGCYVGTTSLVIRRLLEEYHESDKREFHVYDSFKGLPEKAEQDVSAVTYE